MKIVITGAGIVSSLGFGQQATLHALLHEQSGVAAPVYLPTTHREHPVGEVQASNESLAVRLGITETISRTALLGVAAVREALSQAGIDDLSQLAFISGTTVGGMDHTERYWREKESCASSVVELHTAGSSTEQIARQVGTFAMTGTISTACSSALNAVIAACNLLRSGQYRQVVAGGAESLSLFHFNGFRALQILSDEPCRPFSANRKGLNLGEGAAYVVVETEEMRSIRPLRRMMAKERSSRCSRHSRWRISIPHKWIISMPTEPAHPITTPRRQPLCVGSSVR